MRHLFLLQPGEPTRSMLTASLLVADSLSNQSFGLLGNLLSGQPCFFSVACYLTTKFKVLMNRHCDLKWFVGWLVPLRLSRVKARGCDVRRGKGAK